MTAQEIDSQVQQALKTALSIEQVPDNLSQQNCDQWDSLHHLNLIVELEMAFGIDIDPEDIGHMVDYQAICQILTQKYIQ